ncbi:MAG: right-handed parallel beta-helix repeat-containing protein, partial [Candidatus Hodarchaeota archaeon]
MGRISFYILLIIITAFIFLCQTNEITAINSTDVIYQSTNISKQESLTIPPQQSVKLSENKLLASVPPNLKILTNPIYIDGDDEFHSQASMFSWPGDGSLESPYLIGGYSFNGDPEGKKITPIEIINVNLYFIVSNCVLNNSYKGILLRNLANCQILNNIINNSQSGGIHSYWVNNSLISNNTIINTGSYIEENILLQNCKSNTISNNVITKGMSDGIGVKSSPNNLVIDNVIYDIWDEWEPSWGIKIVFDSHNCVVVNNSIDNTKAGILTWSSKNIAL